MKPPITNRELLILIESVRQKGRWAGRRNSRFLRLPSGVYLVIGLHRCCLDEEGYPLYDTIISGEERAWTIKLAAWDYTRDVTVRAANWSELRFRSSGMNMTAAAQEQMARSHHAHSRAYVEPTFSGDLAKFERDMTICCMFDELMNPQIADDL